MKGSNYASRAIIMAAGTGTRMRPVTVHTPKPMIQVNGVRMIDTILDQLMYNGIREIYIVVGYLKEKFGVLLKKYPNVQLIENPYYQSCNNISSLYVAREYLGNCVILDGDQIIYNPDILQPVFDKSGYCSIWCEEDTEEWLQTVQNGTVTACSRTGGNYGWRLVSISFWSQADGRRLRHLLEVEFDQKRHTDLYWDDVAMFCYPEMFDLGIRAIQREDVVEIDSYEELVQMDRTYESGVEHGE